MYKKRIFAFILSLLLIASCLPITASAVSNKIADTSTALPSDYGTNLVKNKFWFTSYTFDGERNVILPSKNTQNLTDGTVSTGDVQFSGFKFAEYEKGELVDHSGYGIGDRYLDIVFDLKSEAYIDGLALLFQENKYLRAREFSVYASTRADDLFESPLFFDNRNKTYDGAYRRMAWNFKGMLTDGDTSLIDDTVVARYVGIRIFTPTAKVNSSSVVTVQSNSSTNNVYVRLEEIAIYGSYTDPDYEYTDTFTPIVGQLTKEELKSYGKSIIAGRKPDSGFYTDGGISLHTTETDGDPTSRIDYNSSRIWDKHGGHSIELTWKMVDKYLVDSFLYLGADNAYATGWYQIYASLDLDILFDDSSMLFEYNAVREVGADAVSSGQYIKLKKPIVAKYFGLKIIYPSTTATEYVYPRIQEFCVYGTFTTEGSPDNVAADMPIKAYLKDGEKLTKYDLSVDQYRKLVDGENKTSAEIKANGKTVEILLDFCRSTPLSEIILKSVVDSSKYIGKHKVYFANDNASIWENSSLIYESDGGQRENKKQFSKPIWAQFMRIEILPCDSVTIAEIEATGRNDYKLPMRSLSRELSNSYYSFFTMNLTNGKITDASKYEAKRLGYLHDSKLNTTLGVQAGKSGKVSSNILVDLKYPAMVHSIRVDFPYSARLHLPTKTRIYISAEYDEITSKDAKVLKEFDGPPVENKKEKALYYNVDILPVTAKYVRIEFLEGGDSKGVFDEMVNAVTEIVVRGTSVSPTYVTKGYIKQFEDTKNGIKWGILKCHNSDMFEDVISSDVTVTDATEWQKSSLRYAPFYRIAGGKVYTFRFYGADGEEITDFGGRKIEFSFKYRDGMSDSNSFVADTGKKWYAVPFTNVSTGNGYITYSVINYRDNFVFSPIVRIKPSDEYWETLGDLEIFDGETPEYRPDILTSTEIRSIHADTFFTYNGKIQQPKFKIIDGAGNILTDNFYTVDMPESVNVGKYKFTVSFKLPYKGQAEVYYYITPLPCDNFRVILSKTSFVYSGKVNRPTVTVTDKDGGTVNPDLYTVSYGGYGKNVGQYAVKVEFCGNYSGSVTKYYTVTKKAITPTVKMSATEFTYDGKAKMPKFTVKYNGNSLAFTLTPKNGLSAVGTHSVTLKLTGNYTFSKKYNFTVRPSAPKITSLAGGKKRLTVKWKKKSEASGYTIMYSTSKNFKKAKTVNISGKSTTKKVLKKLNAKKKYYVKIRCCKTVNGKKYYSHWSKPLTKKTK